ncbi:MAG: 5-carboxymethyl-2-hydroxymuconate Delta-isomerase [Gammaproteobacteria bacterium]
MPHIVLEHSANLIEKANLTKVFQKLHEILSTGLPTNILSCKSRAYECEQFLVGEGQANDAFVHCEIKIMAGRSTEVREQVSVQVIELLQESFAESMAKFNLQVTLELNELIGIYQKR